MSCARAASGEPTCIITFAELVALAVLVVRALAAPPRSLRRRVRRPRRRRPACGHRRTAATRCPGSARGSTLTPSTRRSQPGLYGQPACAYLYPRGCRARVCRTLLPDAAGAGRAAPGSSQLPGSPLAAWGRCGHGPRAAKFSLLGSIHATARSATPHAACPHGASYAQSASTHAVCWRRGEHGIGVLPRDDNLFSSRKKKTNE